MSAPLPREQLVRLLPYLPGGDSSLPMSMTTPDLIGFIEERVKQLPLERRRLLLGMARELEREAAELDYTQERGWGF